MSITYDPMTGEPIETNDEVTETVAEAETVTDTEKEKVAETEAIADTQAFAEAETVAETETVTETENVTEIETVEAAAKASFEISSTDDVQGSEVDPSSDEKDDDADAIRFDPMTGQPINPDDTKKKENKYSPIPADPDYDDNKNFKLIGIIAAVLVGILVIVLIFTSGLFGSKKDRIIKAVKKTFTYDSEIGKIYKNVNGIVRTKDYTVEFDADLDDLGDVSGQAIIDGKDKQLIVDIDVDDIPRMSAMIGIDSKTVKAEVPQFSDKLFVYNYVEEKDGMIVDELDDDQIDSIDSSLKMIYEGYDSDSAKFKDDVIKCINRHLKDLDIENAEKENYRINGKKVGCKGYSVEIDKDFVTDLWDDITDI